MYFSDSEGKNYEHDIEKQKLLQIQEKSINILYSMEIRACLLPRNLGLITCKNTCEKLYVLSIWTVEDDAYVFASFILDFFFFFYKEERFF